MIVRLKNVNKSYGNVNVIEDLNLTIEDKTFTTLLGPSGCGKTTILRMIGGLDIPTSGEIWFDDICMFSSMKNIHIPPEKRNLGFVFQDFALWPHMSIFDNVAFGLKARGDIKDINNRVEKALDSVRLLEFKDRFPSQLSGGQQQRIGFARSIVTNPDCILFDEPLSALDAILRDEMKVEIKRLTKKMNITSIFVTHDQKEAMSMSDCIVVLNKGKIEQESFPEQIYWKPKTKFSAKFIGKSNWIGKDKMFRPETASLSKKEGYKKFETKVESIQFLGSNYELCLDSDGEKWVMETLDKYKIGDDLDVFINEDKIIRFL